MLCDWIWFWFDQKKHLKTGKEEKDERKIEKVTTEKFFEWTESEKKTFPEWEKVDEERNGGRKKKTGRKRNRERGRQQKMKEEKSRQNIFFDFISRRNHISFPEFITFYFSLCSFSNYCFFYSGMFFDCNKQKALPLSNGESFSFFVSFPFSFFFSFSSNITNWLLF